MFANGEHNKCYLCCPCFSPALLAFHPCRGSSPASDAVLSFIASHLGTQPQPSSQPEAAAPAAINARSSSGSGALELHTDARMWEVQWTELTIMRRIGRGSFASVYLAYWSHTRVAVKVLVSKGECSRAGGKCQ